MDGWDFMGHPEIAEQQDYVGIKPCQGLILNIMRFALHDGPGIRTTIFLKGCPLNCWWCHSPESQSRRPKVVYVAER